ncbi:MAG: DUF3592 domain-containing protein [Lachnospiraceae bacterium]
MGGKIFIIIIGAINLLIGLFLLFFYLKIIFNNKCYKARITGVNFGTISAYPTDTYKVSFKYNNEVIQVDTLNRFKGYSLFKKQQYKKIQNKYTRKSVNIYYNPNNPRQTIIKEYIWKEFIMPAFLIALGSLAIILGCLATP